MRTSARAACVHYLVSWLQYCRLRYATWHPLTVWERLTIFGTVEGRTVLIPKQALIMTTSKPEKEPQQTLCKIGHAQLPTILVLPRGSSAADYRAFSATLLCGTD